MTFTDLGLDARLCTALENLGYTEPTPIQQQAIPFAMQGHDVMASAQTGTGKTAAFVLPCLHRVLSSAAPTSANATAANPSHGPRIIVLTPTRELAQQVLDNIRSACKQVRISTGVLFGGVAYGPQMALLRNPLDVLVATPGRLIDHMNEGRVDFSRAEVLVLDEADKMLDMGFLKPVEKVLAAIEETTKRPQILLFSATFTKAVQQFSNRYLSTPDCIELAPKRVSHDHITQRVYRADNAEHKYALLEQLLEEARGERVLVFSATKYGSEKLAKKLVQAGYTADALHGGMKQSLRKRTLGKMHTGDVQVLVATDVAARGIDVKQLGHVINYDLPQVAEDYVHRIGRTGRAGNSGVAISLVAPDDMPMLKDIEKVLGSAVEFLTIAGFEPQMDVRDFNRLGAAAPRSRQKKRSSDSGQRSSNGSDRNSSSFGRSFSRQKAEGAPRSEHGAPKRSNYRADSRSEGRFEGRSDDRSNARSSYRSDSRSEGRFEGRSEGRFDSANSFGNRSDNRSSQRSGRSSSYTSNRAPGQSTERRSERPSGSSTGSSNGRSSGRAPTRW